MAAARGAAASAERLAVRALASFIMKSRMQAISVAAAGALLSLLLPPASYLSGAAVGLVTLRRGPLEGLLIGIGAAVVAALLSGIASGMQPFVVIAFTAVLWLPVWLLALVLRRSISLPTAVEFAALLAGAGVLLTYAVLGDPAAWWAATLEKLFQELWAGEIPPALKVEGGIADVARVMTGFAAASMSLSAVVCLLLARWWQATLYNPGGFRQEFHALRLSRRMVVMTLGLFAAAMIGSGVLGGLATDLALVAMVAFFFQGLAVSHGVAAKFKAARGWLVAMYVLLVIALPQVIVALSGLGFADGWIDFRSRIGGRNESNH